MQIFKSKRKCIFCEGKSLTNEHIYPKWLFDHIKVDTLTFKPSSTAYLIRSTEANDSIESRKWFTDNREINYSDFKTKLVCQECNNGWMSEMENEVKEVITEQLSGKGELKNSSKKAYTLSKWAIIKVILISQTIQLQYEFDRFLLEMLYNDIIPEGFIVEFCEMENYSLNYSIGNTATFQPDRISKEEMDIAAENFFVATLHLANIGLRITFLKTAIAVNRIQINRKLFVLHPYSSQLPYLGLDLPAESTAVDKDSEVIALSNCITICDRFYKN